MANRKRKAASGHELGGPYTDHDLFEPPCHHLASILCHQQIATGLIPSGDRIPSDAQICHEYLILRSELGWQVRDLERHLGGADYPLEATLARVSIDHFRCEC